MRWLRKDRQAGAGAFAVVLAMLVLPPAAALADSGGILSGGGGAPTYTSPPPSGCTRVAGWMGKTKAPCVPPEQATLVHGKAIAPPDAPQQVKAVIAAANRIRHTPYIWGGGHQAWKSPGYDCSGAVSYALHGGGFLSTPLVSGQLMSWGEAKPGQWMTVYAHSGHTYAIIAGLRFDTVDDPPGITGPRWHRNLIDSSSMDRHFVARHAAGF